jgi:heme/copper-type cytochrome/quinol oxidase subunit 3
MSTGFASENAEYALVEGEPPEVLERNLTAAGYLLAGATAFFFVAFLFAFFYLRSVDKPQLWKPPGVDASIGWGTAIVACWVVSAVLVRLARTDRIAGRLPQWRVKGVAALVLGIAGLVLQGIAWHENGFGPTDDAYASVYVGWTAFLSLFVLGTLFWLETTLATSFRYAHLPLESEPAPGEASGDPDRTAHDIQNPLSLVKPELVALSFYWSFLAGIAVITWVVLYLVA